MLICTMVNVPILSAPRVKYMKIKQVPGNSMLIILNNSLSLRVVDSHTPLVYRRYVFFPL